MKKSNKDTSLQIDTLQVLKGVNVSFEQKETNQPQPHQVQAKPKLSGSMDFIDKETGVINNFAYLVTLANCTVESRPTSKALNFNKVPLDESDQGGLIDDDYFLAKLTEKVTEKLESMESNYIVRKARRFVGFEALQTRNGKFLDKQGNLYQVTATRPEDSVKYVFNLIVRAMDRDRLRVENFYLSTEDDVAWINELIIQLSQNQDTIRRLFKTTEKLMSHLIIESITINEAATFTNLDVSLPPSFRHGTPSFVDKVTYQLMIDPSNQSMQNLMKGN